MQTFKQSVDTAIELVESVGSKFSKPDDDWVPVALMRTRGDELIVIGLFADKSQWPEIFRQTRVEHDVVHIVAVLSSWALDKENITPSDLIYIQQHGVGAHPEAHEILLLECSDGRRLETWIADIIRHEDAPPTLGPWKQDEAKEKEGKLANLVSGAFEDTKETSN